MARKLPLIHRYLRKDKKFPTVWCPGCGIGVVLGSLIRAVHNAGIPKDDVVLVSGIGCTGRMPVYVDFNTLHTTHGRALTFASGVRLANPRLKVITVMGDGDAIAIGGNHFIHACRRNIEITAIVVNNLIYGMTGGQFSPTTPTGDISATSPYGNLAQSLDICELARDCGASYVARSTIYHVNEMEKLIARAVTTSGFSVVEVLSTCYSRYGKLNQKGSPREMFLALKDQTVPIAKAAGDGRISRGVFIDRAEAAYSDTYQTIVAKAREHDAGEPPPLLSSDRTGGTR